MMGLRRKQSDASEPWWLEVASGETRPEFAKCPNCGRDVDSVDIFCPSDDTSLLGGLASEHTLLKVGYALRAVAVAAALAVGYLQLTWPAYLAGVVSAFAFGLLLVRNHRASMRYLAAATMCVAVGHWIWQALGAPGLGHVVTGLFVVMFAGEVAFAIALTRRILAESSDWFKAGGQTVLTVTIAVSTAAASAVAAVAASLTPWVPSWLSWLSLHITPLAVSAAAVAVLISSVAYTIRGPMFDVYGVFHYREFLAPAKLGRIAPPPPLSGTAPVEVFANTIECLTIAFANGIAVALEATYNRQVRGLVHGLTKTIVSMANSCYRGALKLAFHIARTAHRFGVVAADGARWSAFVGKRFMTAFAVPVALSWLACAELWWIADEFRRYVSHESAWFTPLLSLLRILSVILILAAMTMASLQVRLSVLARKLIPTASALGGNAFLFFVIVAWTLGIVGWLTDGPYRVGWVTLASTALIACVLIAVRVRRPSAIAVGGLR